MTRAELVVIGGRSGVGKSSVAFALHDLLTDSDVRHAVIEGDALDLAYPPPWEHRLAEDNLSAIWRNYRRLGYRRLIYTNTVSVLNTPDLVRAMGDDPAVTAILLTASDRTIWERLSRRESGDSLARHVARSAQAAVTLDRDTDPAVHRIHTDDLSALQIARQVFSLLGWAAARP